MNAAQSAFQVKGVLAKAFSFCKLEMLWFIYRAVLMLVKVIQDVVVLPSQMMISKSLTNLLMFLRSCVQGGGWGPTGIIILSSSLFSTDAMLRLCPLWLSTGLYSCSGSTPFPFLPVGLVQNFTCRCKQVQVSRAGSPEMPCLFQGMCGLLEKLVMVGFQVTENYEGEILGSWGWGLLEILNGPE